MRILIIKVIPDYEYLIGEIFEAEIKVIDGERYWIIKIINEELIVTDYYIHVINQ